MESKGYCGGRPHLPWGPHPQLQIHHATGHNRHRCPTSSGTGTSMKGRSIKNGDELGQESTRNAGETSMKGRSIKNGDIPV